MAEGESIIETVSVKFRVLEDSLQALKEALAKANQTVVESTDDANKKVIKSHEDMEESLTKIRETHLDKALQMRIREQRALYEMHERQKDWLKEQKELDLKTKYDMMAAEQNAMDQSLANIEKMKKGYGDLKNQIDEVGKAIGINLGEFAKAGTLATAIFTAAGEGRSMERNELLFSAMRGRKLEGGEAELYRKWYSDTTAKSIGGADGIGGKNVSGEEARKVGSAFMGMSYGLTDPSDIFKKGGLADMALFTAPGAGVSTDKAIDYFREMISHLRMSSHSVSEEFMKLVQTSRHLNDASGKYIETTINLAKNFTTYNLDIDTAGKVVRSFWNEIRDGKMAMEDLNKILSMGGRMSEGQNAYIGMEVLGKSEAFRKYYEGQDAIGAAQVTKRLFMGSPMSNEKELQRMLEGTEAERHKAREILNARRNEAIKEVSKDIRGRGAQMAGEGATQEKIDSLVEKSFLTFISTTFPNLAPDMQQEIFRGMESGRLTDKGQEALKAGMTDPTVYGLTKIGEDLRRLDTSPLQDILNAVKELLMVVGSGFMAVVSFLTGDGTSAKRYASLVQSHYPGLRQMDEAMAEREAKLGTPQALYAKGENEAQAYLSQARFSSTEQFEKAMLRATGGKTRSTKQGWMDILEAGSLKTTLEGNLVFDFGNFGTYDVVVQDGKAVAVSSRMPKSGMVNPTATATPSRSSASGGK